MTREELQALRDTLGVFSDLSTSISETVNAKAKYENAYKVTELADYLKTKASNEKELLKNQMTHITGELDASSERIRKGATEINNLGLLDVDIAKLVGKDNGKDSTDDAPKIIKEETSYWNDDLTYTYNRGNTLREELNNSFETLQKSREMEKLMSDIKSEYGEATRIAAEDIDYGMDNILDAGDVLKYIDEQKELGTPVSLPIEKMLQHPYSIDGKYGPVGILGKEQAIAKKTGAGTTDYRKESDDNFKFTLEGGFKNLKASEDFFDPVNNEFDAKFLGYFGGKVSHLESSINSYVDAPTNSENLRQNLAMGLFAMFDDQEIHDPTLRKIVDLGVGTTDPKELDTAMYQLSRFILPKPDSGDVIDPNHRFRIGEKDVNIGLDLADNMGLPVGHEMVKSPGYNELFDWKNADVGKIYSLDFDSGSEGARKYDRYVRDIIGLWSDTTEQFDSLNRNDSFSRMLEIQQLRLGDKETGADKPPITQPSSEIIETPKDTTTIPIGQNLSNLVTEIESGDKEIKSPELKRLSEIDAWQKENPANLRPQTVEEGRKQAALGVKRQKLVTERDSIETKMASELRSLLENEGYNVTIAMWPGADTKWVRSIYEKSGFKSPKAILKDIKENPKKYEYTGISSPRGMKKSKDTPKDDVKKALDNIDIVSLTPSEETDLKDRYKRYKETMNDKDLSYEDYKSWAMAGAY